jgi:hypothetical protein
MLNHAYFPSPGGFAAAWLCLDASLAEFRW